MKAPELGADNMEMTFDEFDALCDQFSALGNPNPEYIPSWEEIESLARLTQVFRPVRAVNRKGSEHAPRVGRPYRPEKDLAFLEPGKEDDPLISQYDFFSFLIYLSETANPSPADPAAAQNLADLNRFLRENLTLV